MQQKKLIIPEPFTADLSDDYRLMVRTRPDIFNYFFRHIFPDERGIKQNLVNTMILKLYEACLAAGIEGSWDAGINGKKVAELLDKMNFRDEVQVVEPAPEPVKPKRAPRKKKKEPVDVIGPIFPDDNIAV